MLATPKSQAVRIHQERNRNKIRKLMLVIAAGKPTFFDFYLTVVPLGLDETLWDLVMLNSVFDQAHGKRIRNCDIEDYSGTVTASAEAHYYARGHL